MLRDNNEVLPTAARFDGRVVLITGGARGLGKACAQIFGARGAALFLVDVLEEELAETRDELEMAGVECATMACDISERQNCVAAVAAAVEIYGRLDVLCNVAATLRFHHVTQVTELDWAKVMAVNLSAPFWFSQAAIPHLLARHGNIVNVTSQAGTIGCAYIVPYAASKGGLLQMTRSMAMEFMDQPIRINAVAPGAMSTEIGKGIVRPEDLDTKLIQRYSGLRPPSDVQSVAELIVFTASGLASALHGACLAADGGVTAG
jgi:NAD(P)-dependent dehydrogenase (short-subunit alcohol dehydrogenase family)